MRVPTSHSTRPAYGILVVRENEVRDVVGMIDANMSPDPGGRCVARAHGEDMLVRRARIFDADAVAARLQLVARGIVGVHRDEARRVERFVELLNISVERAAMQSEAVGEDMRTYAQERFVGFFRRVIELPEHAYPTLSGRGTPMAA